MSYGIPAYSGSSDILKIWINAELPIMKSDLIVHSWVGYTCGIDMYVFRYNIFMNVFVVQCKLKWKTCS